MKQQSKLFLNMSFALLYQTVVLVIGFILPRFFLKFYGSEVNGLVSSITQFLGFISLAECGIGAVVQSALYKPLAEKDNTQISLIIVSAEKFFRKVAMILTVYIIFLIVFYPTIVNSFARSYVSCLIIILSVNLLIQYYFSMTYRLLLGADQKSYIQSVIGTLSLIVNAVLSIILMNNGFDILFVKLFSAAVYIVQPLILVVYVKKKYSINKKVKISEEPIKQKWNGLAQHIASVVLNNTDIVVLTVFSSLTNVSIYYIYNMIVTGVKQLVMSLTTGMQALLGNLIARNESGKLNSTFEYIEWGIHVIIVFSFACTSYLIIPFVGVYTNGITDAKYIVPTFAIILTSATGMYCLRLPYNIMVLAAGHYKQTQTSAIVESILNIVISVLLVVNYGLVGVACGTLVAMFYRTVYLAYYVSKNLLNRSFSKFVKLMCFDVVVIIISSFVMKYYNNVQINTYLEWFFLAFKVALIELGIISVINFICYREKLILLYHKARGGVR